MRPEIYLDLDGTILDVAARYHHVHLETVRALGAESTIGLDAFWSQKRSGLSNARILADEKLAIAPADYAAAFLARIETDEAQALDTVLPGAMDALAALAGAHTLVIVTLRREREPLLRSLAHLAIDVHVGAVLSGSPLDGRGEATKAALVRAHGTPSPDSWMVGDTEIDVRAGKQLGIRTCAVTSGIRTRDLLQIEAPDRIEPDLISFARTLG